MSLLPKQKRLNTGRTNLQTSAGVAPAAESRLRPPPRAAGAEPRGEGAAEGAVQEQHAAHGFSRASDRGTDGRSSVHARERGGAHLHLGAEAHSRGARGSERAGTASSWLASKRRGDDQTLHQAGFGGKAAIDMARRVFEPLSAQLRTGDISLGELEAALKLCGVVVRGGEGEAELRQLRTDLLHAAQRSERSGGAGAFEVFMEKAQGNIVQNALPSIFETGVHAHGEESDELRAGAAMPLLRLDKLHRGDPSSRMGTAASRIGTSVSAREHRDQQHSSRLDSLTSRDWPKARKVGVGGVISSDAILREVLKERERFVPKQKDIVPRFGDGRLFKSSDGLKVALKPWLWKNMNPVDRSHFLPADDTYITSKMMADGDPVGQGHEFVRGVIDGDRKMKQRQNRLARDVRNKERAEGSYQEKDNVKKARVDKGIADRAAVRKLQQAVIDSERPRPDDFDARKRSEMNRFHVSPQRQQDRLENHFSPFKGVCAHHNQEGSWSPGKEPRLRDVVKAVVSSKTHAGGRCLGGAEMERTEMSENGKDSGFNRGPDRPQLAGSAQRKDGEQLEGDQAVRMRMKFRHGQHLVDGHGVSEESKLEVLHKKDAAERAKVAKIRAQQNRYQNAIQAESNRREQCEIFKLNKLHRHKARYETSLQEEQQHLEDEGHSHLVHYANQQRRHAEYAERAEEKAHEKDKKLLLFLKRNQDHYNDFTHLEEEKKETHERLYNQALRNQKQHHLDMAFETAIGREKAHCKAHNGQFHSVVLP